MPDDPASATGPPTDRPERGGVVCLRPYPRLDDFVGRAAHDEIAHDVDERGPLPAREAIAVEQHAHLTGSGLHRPEALHFREVIVEHGLYQGRFWLARTEIHATDVDRVSLERAAAGVYRTDAFQDLPAPLFDRYTVPHPAGRAVVPAVRNRVTVLELELGRAAPPAPAYDLILCRNVVIYFDRPLQEQVFVTFARLLRPGGVLVLGKVETLLGPARDLLQLVDVRERIYRRRA